MKSHPVLLSKSKLMRGIRCLKCIYLTVHQPYLEAEITAETQALFDQGNEVGEYARKYFPGGVLVDHKPWDFAGALAKTKQLMQTKDIEIIFEAAFEFKGCYARVDIMQYSPESKRWRIFEVKSTTKVKPEHIDDVGLQAWIMAKSGIKIEQINILHLNPDCRYPDLSHLFVQQDITDEVRATYLDIQPKVHQIFTTLLQDQPPAIDIGPYCLLPNECGFKDHCFKEKNIGTFSILNLPGLKEKKWEYYKNGVVHLEDFHKLPLSPQQQKIVSAHLEQKRFIDQEGIQRSLSQWQFPLVFLDFETINPAIPCYPGCGPYQHVPFQFSVHTWEHQEAPLKHQYYLHDAATDPRPELTTALIEALGNEGSIVAYHGKFEAARMNELAQFSPAYAEKLNDCIDRIVDPLPIIRECVYDYRFAGSFSLKNVAPALLGDPFSYENMLVADGGEAQRAFKELISPTISKQRKHALREALLVYCEKDTLVMVELVKWLMNNVENT